MRNVPTCKSHFAIQELQDDFPTTIMRPSILKSTDRDRREAPEHSSDHIQDTFELESTSRRCRLPACTAIRSHAPTARGRRRH